MAKELYVGHISEQATEDDLRKLFSLMGPVTSVHLIVNQETGEFKRCGYVRMLASVDLKEVVETLDGTWLIDRCIVVSIAKPQKDRPAKSTGIRRKPGTSVHPAAVMETNRNERASGARSVVRNDRPAANDSAKTGRSFSAQESARPGRPTAAKDSFKSGRPTISKAAVKSERPATPNSSVKSRPPAAAVADAIRKERPAPSNRASKNGYPAASRKPGVAPRPPSKGRK